MHVFVMRTLGLALGASIVGFLAPVAFAAAQDSPNVKNTQPVPCHAVAVLSDAEEVSPGTQVSVTAEGQCEVAPLIVTAINPDGTKSVIVTRHLLSIGAGKQNATVTVVPTDSTSLFNISAKGVIDTTINIR